MIFISIRNNTHARCNGYTSAAHIRCSNTAASLCKSWSSDPWHDVECSQQIDACRRRCAQASERNVVEQDDSLGFIKRLCVGCIVQVKWVIRTFIALRVKYRSDWRDRWVMWCLGIFMYFIKGMYIIDWLKEAYVDWFSDKFYFNRCKNNDVVCSISNLR